MNIFSKNNILICVGAIAIIVVGVLIYVNPGSEGNQGFSFSNIFGISKDQVGKNTVDYINNNQLSVSPASLVSASEVSGVVKLRIKINENEFDTYVTKDGKLLFPQVIEMTSAEKNTENTDPNQDQKPVSVEKTDSPMLEAYVVSRCPYGLQMQRAMADAVKNQPELNKYLKVRYMGAVSGNTITAMHGDAEAKENLRQICIREEQPAKYWDYVSCQMKSGDTTGCEASTGVNSAKLSACMTDSNKGIVYAQKDFDLNTKYNVSGSPTMILNGTKISESSFGGRSSDGVKSMACAGFNSEPSFCSETLNTAEAAVSFSNTYASASGNTGSNTNCAPAQ